MMESPQLSIRTNPEMFKKFNVLLVKNAPIGYKPFYFPCMKMGKDPVAGVSWKKNRKTFEQALKLMELGYNIGIAGTEHDPLCIMDVDDISQVDLTEVKPTLTVFSRKRVGRHFYYFATDSSAKRNIATTDAGEIRAWWQYTLTPGSYVPCDSETLSKIPSDQKHLAGSYTVESEHAVSRITFDEFPSVYKDTYFQLKKSQEEAEKRAEERKNRKPPKLMKYKSALWDLSITEVSGVPHTGYNKVPMPSQIHGSETGHNCSVDQGLLHCWRHCVAHSALSYLAVCAGVMPCERAGKPHGGGSFGVDFHDGETIFRIWLYAKRAGLIPIDDPIPHAALIYYAIDRGICKRSQLEEGRLPAFIYIITLLLAQKEGINFGRA